MKNQYTVPELKAIGQADQVVLGSFSIGDDIRGEFQLMDAEFQADQEMPTDGR